MRPMLEINIIRHLSHLEPLNGFFLAPVVSQLSYLGICPRRNFVTAHATLYGRNTSDRSLSRVNVTVLAVDFIVARMDLMVKRNGLLRRSRRIAGVSESYFDGDSKKRKEAYSDQPLFHLALFFLTKTPYISDEVVDLLVG